MILDINKMLNHIATRLSIKDAKAKTLKHIIHDRMEIYNIKINL